MIKAHSIPSELVLNWDQTGIHLVPAPDWTMDSRGAQRVEIAHLGDKQQVTATFASSLSGVFLPMHILYAGKTDRCHPHYTMPPEFDIWHTPNHWGNTECTICFIEKWLFPMSMLSGRRSVVQIKLHWLFFTTSLVIRARLFKNCWNKIESMVSKFPQAVLMSFSHLI